MKPSLNTKKRKNPFLIVLYYLLIPLPFSTLFAQSFIEVPDLSTMTLNPEQLACKSQFENEADVLSFQIVDLQDITSIQQNGLLSVTIPGNPNQYDFKARYVNVTDNGDYTWVGRLMNTQQCANGTAIDSCSYGRISILKKANRSFGELYVDTTFYKIRSIGGGLSALIEIDQRYHQQHSGCAVSDSNTALTNNIDPEEDPEPIVASRGVDPCPVQCLVLYTEAALAASPDIEDVIFEAILNTNTFLKNSKIAPYQLKIHLAGIQALTEEEWEENSNITIDVANIANDANILGYRDQYDADIVVVLTDAVYPSVTGAVTDFGDDPSDAVNAFALVEVQFANGPQFTFPHEVGHLFGARHEGTNLCPDMGDDSGLPPAHGFTIDMGCNCWIFGSKRHWKTTMAVCTNIDLIPRIPYYSTPKVKFPWPFYGKDIGLAGSNDNASILKGAACRVSSYVWSDEPIVTIGADVDGCPAEVISATANVQGVPTPHVYEWRTSTDGVNWGGIVSTNFAYLVTLPNEAGAVVHLQLRAGNVNGTLTTDVHSILVIDDEFACVRDQGEKKITEKSIENSVKTLDIYPNPAYQKLNIVVNGLMKGNYQVDLFDISGNKLLTLNSRKEQMGPEWLDLDLSTLPSGMYWIRCKGLNFNQVTRFVIGQ